MAHQISRSYASDFFLVGIFEIESLYRPTIKFIGAEKSNWARLISNEKEGKERDFLSPLRKHEPLQMELTLQFSTNLKAQITDVAKYRNLEWFTQILYQEFQQRDTTCLCYYKRFEKLFLMFHNPYQTKQVNQLFSINAIKIK